MDFGETGVVGVNKGGREAVVVDLVKSNAGREKSHILS